LQFLVMMRRNLTQRFARAADTLSAYGVTVTAGAAVGIVFGASSDLDTILTLGWLNGMMIGMLAASSALAVFEREMHLYWRERDCNLSTLAFVLAKNLDYLNDMVIHTLLYALLVYNLTVPWSSFGAYFGLLLLMFWAASGVGLFVSVIVPSGYSFVVTVMVPLVLGGFFSGVTPALADYNAAMKVVAWFSYARWGVEAMAIEDASNLPSYTYPSPQFYAEQSGYSYSNQYMDVWILIVHGMTLRLLAYICLHYDVKRKTIDMMLGKLRLWWLHWKS